LDNAGKESHSKIPLANPVFDKEMVDAAIYAMQNERFVLGESVHKFEEEFAGFCGTKFAVSTASGTAALILSNVALGVSPGDVITSSESFVATANSIIHAGLTPRLVDITLETYTIDPARLASLITKRTRAILPVHLYGFPAAMDEICRVAEQHDLTVVEDACQAHGALYKGKKVGSIGKVGCFSFYPSKNMTVAGDGGMATTDDETIADRIVSLRDGGRRKGAKYIHDVIGFTERLNNIQAAIGRVQLKRLDRWNERRREIASMYDRLLSGLDEVITPPKGDFTIEPVYHLYVIRCQKRDSLHEWMGKVGVECGIHYPFPIHQQPAYKGRLDLLDEKHPNSERLCREALSLPMYIDLTVDQIRYVCDNIREFYNKEKTST
jgi:perosamine synthetase